MTKKSSILSREDYIEACEQLPSYEWVREWLEARLKARHGAVYPARVLLDMLDHAAAMSTGATSTEHGAEAIESLLR